MSHFLHGVDRLSHHGEAGVSERHFHHVGFEHLERGATNGIIGGEVVGDDSLLLERFNEILNLLGLSDSSHHDSQDAVCETFCGRNCGRITLDLKFLGSGSR